MESGPFVIIQLLNQSVRQLESLEGKFTVDLSRDFLQAQSLGIFANEVVKPFLTGAVANQDEARRLCLMGIEIRGRMLAKTGLNECIDEVICGSVKNIDAAIDYLMAIGEPQAKKT